MLCLPTPGTESNVLLYIRRLASEISGLIPGLRPANERRRYFVTTSLTGWVHTLNQSALNLDIYVIYDIAKRRPVRFFENPLSCCVQYPAILDRDISGA